MSETCRHNITPDMEPCSVCDAEKVISELYAELSEWKEAHRKENLAHMAMLNQLKEARQTIEKQKAEIVELSSDFKVSEEVYKLSIDKNNELLAILDEVGRALDFSVSIIKKGSHTEFCRKYQVVASSAPIKCTCGFEDAVLEIEKALASLREWRKR